MVLVVSPRPTWAPLLAFSLNYEQACAAACSLLHTGTVALHTIPGLCPGYASKDLYSFLLDFGLPPCADGIGNSAHVNTKNVDSGHVDTFNVDTIVK
ncbi:hypothetical protein DSO57_1025131 [Entomophthora muscae]|uniref:Uncharacterized protein n=1 Tax=Entomophthora muscae TaxID=34485 RepID=A0ACC2S4F3_9FUNG|nr:hypothetical protein DSO57_1025131 [Entomophthora muscae]